MRRVCFLVLLFLFSFGMRAQISVRDGSFKEVGQFYTMLEDMTDDNYTPFAVIRVKTEKMTAEQVEKLNFYGDARTFFNIEFHDTEVWVYLTYLATYLKITHPDLSSTEFTIPYDMKPLQGYELVLVNGAVARTGGGKGVLKITTKPAGATVFLNGVQVSATTPYINDMIAAGQYELMVSKKEYQNVTRQITIEKDKELDINIDMDLSYGKINVNSTPSGVKVYIDGVHKGVTPLIITDVQIGDHMVKLAKDELDAIEEIFTLKEGEEFFIDKTLAVSQVVKTYKVKDVSFDVILVRGNDDIQDFYIGKFEVTQELWRTVMGDNPSKRKGSKLPVESLSWNDCQEFIKKLNKKTKANFRLPTKAEWQYAAQGGKWSKGYEYSGSNNIDDVAWYKGNCGSYLVGNYSRERQEDYFKMTSQEHVVGMKQANELGLYDMCGNVYEICSDVDDKGYRTAMGGSYTCEADRCRTTSTVHMKPDVKFSDLGLRLVIQ